MTRRRRLVAAALACLPACGSGSSDAGAQVGGEARQPRRVDRAAIADERLVDAVLGECHGPPPDSGQATLRGGMDRIALFVTVPDGTELHAFAQLPDRLRINAAGGPQLLVGDTAVAVQGGQAVPLPADAAARLRALRALIDAAAFGPLYRATACRRAGDDRYVLTLPDGEATLELNPQTLLPAALAGAAGRVRFLDYARNPVTWVVQRAELAPLGICSLRFRGPEFHWDDGLFALPAAPTAAPAAAVKDPRRVVAPGNAIEGEPAVPELRPVRAVRWIVVDDPGDWPGRARLYRQHAEALQAQDQALAGFPAFFREQEHDRLAIGFRARGDRVYAPAAGTDVRDFAAGNALVVYPPTGDYAERVRAGTEMLGKALQQRGLRALGPITAQPFLHLESDEPPAGAQPSTKVRMAVLVP